MLTGAELLTVLQDVKSRGRQTPQMETEVKAMVLGCQGSHDGEQ